MLGIVTAGIVLGAAFNVGTRMVDSFVKNKDTIKEAYKCGIEVAKKASNNINNVE